jgi:hypothetical protein
VFYDLGFLPVLSFTRLSIQGEYPGDFRPVFQLDFHVMFQTISNQITCKLFVFHYQIYQLRIIIQSLIQVSERCLTNHHLVQFLDISHQVEHNKSKK